MVSSYLLMFLVLLLVGGLVCAGAIVLSAWSLLHPPRMTDAKALYALRRMSPGDLQLRFEDVSFHVRDQRRGAPLHLKAWWIPAIPGNAGTSVSDRCVLLLHGYADAKVGAIAWAPLWHRHGFHVLALDLRAHGESGGTKSTSGFFERHDVAQVLDQLRAERPAETCRVILFGASSGAAVALATALEAERTDTEGANRIAAVVLESPYADFRRATAAHMELLGLPSRWLAPAAVALAERWSGADFGVVRPLELIRQVTCPVLLLASDPDPYLPPADQAAMEAALQARPAKHGPSRVCRFEDAGHLMAFVADAKGYERCLTDFTSDVLERVVIR